MGCLSSKPKNKNKKGVNPINNYNINTYASPPSAPNPVSAFNAYAHDEDTSDYSDSTDEGSGSYEESPLTPLFKEHLAKWTELRKNLAEEVKQKEKQINLTTSFKKVAFPLPFN